MKKTLIILSLLVLANPARADRWDVTANTRARVEVYDFFDPGVIPVGSQNQYAFFANLLKIDFARKGKERDYLVELAMPALLGLPENAIAPAPKGQLGLGGSYFLSNGEQDASLFVKQAWVNFHAKRRHDLALKVGRMDFVEGQESLSGDPVLDWLKRERIAHRLIGNFAFSHVQRSFDGLVLTGEDKHHQVTAMAAMPTRGVFNLDGMGTIPGVGVAYGAYNWKGDAKRADGRMFAVAYEDERGGLVKVDNRAIAVRTADGAPIHILTLGGDVLARVGGWDFLGWAVFQAGDWGVQEHRAWAYAAEAGHQWPKAHWKPWLRFGVDANSGDAKAGDGRHGTFFAVLPTPRIYARFPWFNDMNLTDAFLSLITKPSKKVTLRSEYHDLNLTESADLWYSGGGAFETTSFGYAGRPSGGFSKLGDMFDTAVDWKLSDRWALTLYGAYVDGGSVVRSVFPAGAHANFSYLEATHRF